MIIRMAHCIGKSGCDGHPCVRGLCSTCYARHQYNGTLKNFPTMKERAQALRRQGVQLLVSQPPSNGSDAQRAASSRRRKTLYAQRVLLDGFTVHPEASHGWYTAYTTWGCRGPMCRDAQRHYRATGEGSLPPERRGQSTTIECLTYTEKGHF